MEKFFKISLQCGGMGVYMDSHQAWDLFICTGSIDAYLMYRELCLNCPEILTDSGQEKKEEKNVI